MKKNSVGDMIKAWIIGTVVGCAAVFYMYHIGETTSEVIFGASVGMTRFYLTIICTFACLISEMSENSSSREVVLDLIFCMIIARFCARDGYLTKTSESEMIFKMIKPIMGTTLFASFASRGSLALVLKLFKWRPGSKAEDADDYDEDDD